ncbi:MAG: RnfH family protein [Gammaproteobacteria bacterium]|nr:RnfH family protein [Gammaproteobacteria bacterium]
MDVAEQLAAITVEVVYTPCDEQASVNLQMKIGATLRDAVERSGLLARFADIDLNINKTGIYGKPASLNHRLRDRDRVEIYRPLRADPKESRRQRARERFEPRNSPGR